MLPELLFSVGGSMQDISRDDFSLLNGGCDKDVSPVARSSPSLPPQSLSPRPNYNTSTPPPVTSSDSPTLESSNIKLEDTNRDLYNTPSWHHPEIETSKLLLKNSDDPLISRGATSVDDDNPTELSSMVAAVRVNIPTIVPTTTPAKRNRNSGATGARTRKKGTFKLRFHHQALPAEYLNHYEATQNQQQNRAANSGSTTSNKKCETNTHDTVRSWLQKISEMQVASNELKESMDVTENIAAIEPSPTTAEKSPRRVVKYSDLPYMGEMTLENSKPRRGRKPKKADICHLIYKNYGTIFPGTPKDLMDFEPKEENKCSLLEKRLSNNSKEVIKTRNGTNLIEEPLNLCLRDQSTDSVTISSEGEDSNGNTESNRTTPLTTTADPATDALLAANLKMSLPNFQSAMLEKNSEESKTPSTGDSEKPPSPNYVYWPAAGIFIHPMALYYQKMMKSGSLQPPTTTPPVTSTTKSSPGGVYNHSKSQTNHKIIQKNSQNCIKKEAVEQPESPSTPSSTKSNASTGNSTTTTNPQPPQKRKRSAIFIPPMPAENTTNPATEVSICKFKFTGGAKPSLQEKKMLSVDSDGNYRYYSGTGDKSMRGYEFFPRESLQQSGVLPGVNCAGAFLNATGEKISNDIPPPSAGLSNELLQIPDSPTGSLLLPNSRSSPSTPSTSNTHRQQLLTTPGNERRKRKSRRSLQREKLEQTFKEKGFLIQTQQLESAEGATYCKFRQLRKFTRYLFRSWKDYLPGELQQANAAAVAAATAAGQNTSTTVRNLLESSTPNKAATEKPRKT